MRNGRQRRSPAVATRYCWVALTARGGGGIEQTLERTKEHCEGRDMGRGRHRHRRVKKRDTYSVQYLRRKGAQVPRWKMYLYSVDDSRFGGGTAGLATG